MPPVGPRKYDPLAAYLAALPVETTTVTLTLAEIEALIGAPLPASAWLPSWWVNAAVGQPQVRAWSAAGRRAVQLHLRQTPPSVTFVRADVPA